MSISDLGPLPASDRPGLGGSQVLAIRMVFTTPLLARLGEEQVALAHQIGPGSTGTGVASEHQYPPISLPTRYQARNRVIGLGHGQAEFADLDRLAPDQRSTIEGPNELVAGSEVAQSIEVDWGA